MARRVKQLLPQLRFPEFDGDWTEDRIDSFVERVSQPVSVGLDTVYREIGVRSHGRGVFHKPETTGEKIGNKRVFWVHPNAFVVNIVFGWEQAVALTSESENGFIASHRFPMYVPIEERIDLGFMLRFFLRPRGKHLLELASPGGAGRNKTLGQGEFAKLKIVVPSIDEQRKIAAALQAVDDKLTALRRKRERLTTYKRGLMQQLFSQELRFTRADGRPFPDWEVRRLGEITKINMGQSPSSETYNNLAQGLPLIQGNADISNRTTSPRRFTTSPTKI